MRYFFCISRIISDYIIFMSQLYDNRRCQITRDDLFFGKVYPRIYRRRREAYILYCSLLELN